MWGCQSGLTIRFVFLWVWFINLFNFMDGIDGITGVEPVIAGGLVLVGGFAGLIRDLSADWDCYRSPLSGP